MSDGASMGVKAERALETILGGKPSPAEDEQMDPVAFERWILDGPDDWTKGQSYDDGARGAAKKVLLYLRDHPEAAARYLDERREDTFSAPHHLYDAAAKARPSSLDDELTGFMVGWAVNAALRCLELPPGPNPAILTLKE